MPFTTEEIKQSLDEATGADGLDDHLVRQQRRRPGGSLGTRRGNPLLEWSRVKKVLVENHSYLPPSWLPVVNTVISVQCEKFVDWVGYVAKATGLKRRQVRKIVKKAVWYLGVREFIMTNRPGSNREFYDLLRKKGIKKPFREWETSIENDVFKFMREGGCFRLKDGNLSMHSKRKPGIPRSRIEAMSFWEDKDIPCAMGCLEFYYNADFGFLSWLCDGFASVAHDEPGRDRRVEEKLLPLLEKWKHWRPKQLATVLGAMIVEHVRSRNKGRVPRMIFQQQGASVYAMCSQLIDQTIPCRDRRMQDDTRIDDWCRDRRMEDVDDLVVNQVLKKLHDDGQRLEDRIELLSRPGVRDAYQALVGMFPDAHRPPTDLQECIDRYRAGDLQL